MIMPKAIAFGTVWPLSNAFFLYRQTPVLVKRTELILFYLVTITIKTGMIMAFNKIFTAVVAESTVAAVKNVPFKYLYFNHFTISI